LTDNVETLTESPCKALSEHGYIGITSVGHGMQTHYTPGPIFISFRVVRGLAYAGGTPIGTSASVNNIYNWVENYDIATVPWGYWAVASWLNGNDPDAPFGVDPIGFTQQPFTNPGGNGIYQTQAGFGASGSQIVSAVYSRCQVILYVQPTPNPYVIQLPNDMSAWFALFSNGAEITEGCTGNIILNVPITLPFPAFDPAGGGGQGIFGAQSATGLILEPIPHFGAVLAAGSLLGAAEILASKPGWGTISPAFNSAQACQIPPLPPFP
jgi:hypothetical protein